MTESVPTARRVQAALDRFLDRQGVELVSIAPDLAPFVDHSRALLAGGKRFRAHFCYWGWRAAGGADAHHLDVIDVAGAALEMFHAAALVHDDLIDNSDTRRGAPAAHRRFESLHHTEGWSGDADAFGRSSALLLGDLLLGWSDELLDDASTTLTDASSVRRARREFNRMRTEVTAGQYLDVQGEHSWRSWPEEEQLGRAQRVAVYKSAKYSIEAPLVIGAALAGADDSLLDGLRDFGLPLGVAFQMRDDLLGVFGDPEQTGKPAGDDLREGKRTVLIAQARRRLPAPSARLVDELLGDPTLSEGQIASLQSTLRASGAVEDVEKAIARNTARALSALEAAPIDVEARTALQELARRVSERVV